MRACPFCKSGEFRAISVTDSWTEAKNYRVVCELCDAMGPVAKTLEQAQKKWDGYLANIKDNRKFKEALNESYKFSDFSGLEEAAEIFYPFEILNVKRDPENYNVYLMLIEFTTGSRYKGRFGLCVYDIDQKKFIEEPGDLDDYDTTAEELYNKYRFIVPGFENLDEDAMGGVSAPMATLNNTPGVGNAVPAAKADGNAIGSGDKWGDGDMYDQNGKLKAKKKKKKKVSESTKRAMANDMRFVNEEIVNYDGTKYTVEDTRDDKILLKPLRNPYGGPYHSSPMSYPMFWTTRNDPKIINENNLNPYDKIGGMMAKKMGVKQPFKKKDSRTNTVEQEEIDEKAQTPPVFKIETLDSYAKASKLVPLHPLQESEELRDVEALKDVKGKEAMDNLGIAYEFKPAKSGKNRVFIKDKMTDVLDKLKEGGWEEYGKNPENTIRKYSKDEEIITIYADGKELPRVTLAPKEEPEVAESVKIRKVVSNSLNPYLKS